MMPKRLAYAVIRRVARSPLALLQMTAGEEVRNDRGAVLDRQVQGLLRLIGSSRFAPHRGSVAHARRLFEFSSTTYCGPLLKHVAMTKRVLPGPDGTKIPVRIFRPQGLPSSAPILVYYHGGGFTIGSSKAYTRPCQVLADQGRCVVVSVDYRLAPEHPYPAPVNDVVAAYRWVQLHASELGGRPGWVAVGGDSAGGNLAAVVCLMAREAGFPPPAAQVLIYPLVDQRHTQPSRTRFGDGFLLTRELIDFFRRQYIPEGVDVCQAKLSPLLAPSHEHLPPAVIVTAGFDPLRDEGEAYHHKLRAAGTASQLLAFETLIHGFVNLDGVVAQATHALETLGSAISDCLAACEPR
ncbi:MAG: alpha/beta hydrolase [Nannocystaceae bacterium]